MAINIPTINEKFLDNNGQVNSTWYNYLRTGGASNTGDVLPNFFIVSGAYIQASNYWLNLSVDNGWLSGDTYQGAYADLLKLSDASGVNIRFTTSDARDTEIATYGESGAFVLDTNNKRFKIPMVTKTIGNLSILADIGTVFGNSAASGSAVYAGVKFPYFMKVGNKTLEASTVDLKKEAEDQKAAISSLGQAQLEAISSAGNTQIALIESAGTTQVNTITSAGTIQYDAITLNGTTWKNDIIATGTLWQGNVNTAGITQVDAVNTAGDTQVGLVNTAGTTQIGLVNTAGDTQVGLVNSAGATQVGLVEDEGNTQVDRVISEGTSYVTAAQNWAIKADGPVSGSDYSSKYNANLAYTYAQSVNPDNIVHIAGTETITGIKTFSETILGNILTATSAGTLTTARNIAISGMATGTATSFDGSADISIPITAIQSASAIQAGVVDTAEQTIAGVKTFSSSPIVPTPTTDYQAATKKYVDDNVISDYANQSLSNINKTAKESIANYAMPSDTYDTLTLGASGTTYTAPANGFYYIVKRCGVSNTFFDFNNKTTGIIKNRVLSLSGSSVLDFVQVRKGDILSIDYDMTGATLVFRFYYAQGEI